ncbi:MAG: adenylosuccinate synthetase [Candidatus Woesearchaeota archaeon]
MAVDMILGGFYGDEGKGCVMAYLVCNDKYDYSIRAGGGPQAGHTPITGVKLAQLPAGILDPDSRLLIGKGTVIDPERVLKEINDYDDTYNIRPRLQIDPGCTIVSVDNKLEETGDHKARLGSVGSGCGPARKKRIDRITGILAKDCEEIKEYVGDVTGVLQKALDKNASILAEGSHGYALSLFEPDFYPYVTSQQCTASQALSDIGAGPKDSGEIYVVFKPWMSCVGERPFPDEWSPEEIKTRGIDEYGTVSGRQRRAAPFNDNLAIRAMNESTGTQVAVTNIDRFFPGNSGRKKLEKLTYDARKFLDEKTQLFSDNCRYFNGITLISTGPDLENMIDLR